jgi:hypothetical protein
MDTRPCFSLALCRSVARARLKLQTASIFLLACLGCGESGANSIRFFGGSPYANAVDAHDRVRIRIDALPAASANIGATDTTVEFWMKAAAAENSTGTPNCTGTGSFEAPDRWIPGHIIIDQDIAGASPASGAYADWGVSVGGTTLAYGVRGRSGGGITICSNTGVLDNAWHHVALQRRVSDGRLWIFVDGALTATGIGAAGDKSYPANFQTDRPGSDPYTVIGAEKIGNFVWPNFAGWITELRFSTALRYGAATALGAVFTRPTARFVVDSQTASLWRFNEGSGSVAADAAGNSPGEVRFTPNNLLPAWSTDSPFPAATPCALDVDGNRNTTANTDGVLIIRHLFGLSGNALTDGALGAGASRDAAQIASYLTTLNLNADGSASASSAATDGLLIFRALAQRTGAALSNAALGTSATRDSQQIIDWIRSTHGVSCIP